MRSALAYILVRRSGGLRCTPHCGSREQVRGTALGWGVGMSRIANNPVLLGFEDIERMLDRVGKGSGDAYPPYNIERIRGAKGEGDIIRIVLAVAGFTSNQLEIAVEDAELTIRGMQEPRDEKRDFLHRGIAARPFQRGFVLADGLAVRSAGLDNGLLTIELTRPEPSGRVKRIEIKDP